MNYINFNILIEHTSMKQWHKGQAIQETGCTWVKDNAIHLLISFVMIVLSLLQKYFLATQLSIFHLR